MLRGPMRRDEIVALDRRHVWRPYTSSEDHEGTDPLVVVGAEGAWLTDADGHRYLDGNASWWTANLGHRHPRLIQAVKDQLDRLPHVSMAGVTNEPAARLAKELVDVAPTGLTRVFYSDDGSTSVEVAVKMAFQYWRQNGRAKRGRFISLSQAYHGDTVGAMSVGGEDELHAVYGPLLFDVVHAPEPADEHGWDRVVARIEELLRKEGDEIAAVIVEPLVQGAAGMRIWSAGLLRRLREATTAADTFLIADEVFTGYGRTGPMWACDHASITPDLMCVAKGFSGGILPFAATLATDRIFDGFRGGTDRALMHGHTFCGNPLGAALAREVLAVYRDEGVLEGIEERSVRMAEVFRDLGELDGVHRARTLGMVAAVDVGATGYHGRLGWDVYSAARERRGYVRPLGNTVYLVPPLNIPLDDLDQLLGIVADSVTEVARRSG